VDLPGEALFTENHRLLQWNGFMEVLLAILAARLSALLVCFLGRNLAAFAPSWPDLGYFGILASDFARREITSLPIVFLRFPVFCHFLSHTFPADSCSVCLSYGSISRSYGSLKEGILKTVSSKATLLAYQHGLGPDGKTKSTSQLGSGNRIHS
jgi:hypothetical protein